MADQDWRQRIVCDPGVHHGEPVIRGTRVSVAVLVANLADLSIPELLAEYPQISVDDVRAALLFASECSHGSMVY